MRHVRRAPLGLLKKLGALCALSWAGAAMACSCMYGEDAGFIHAQLERLPANARGVLFRLPQGEVNLPPDSDFVITSDRDGSAMKARLTLLAEVIGHEQQPRLLRVAPAGGFRPGTRYTISYRGSHENWVYPASTAFTVDHAVLAPGAYHIAVTAKPARRLLPLPEDVGCSSNAVVVAAEFQYALPAHYAPYRAAMMVDSAQRASDNTFRPVAYQASLCDVVRQGVSGLPDGKELVHASCGQGQRTITVRGRAGLLEVEDRLRATNELTIALPQAAGDACSATAMLNEAVARGDLARIRELACQVSNEAWREGAMSTVTRPTFGTLFALTRLRATIPEHCIGGLAYKWREEARSAFGPVQGAAVRAAYTLGIVVRERITYLAELFKSPADHQPPP